jgi:A/G-specific adenine glycosylase
MSPIAKEKKYFTRELLRWHREENVRSLPWKEEKDPYKIWLSEIILQQTRAEQGLPYFIRFTEKYPAVADLGNAPDEEVFRLWQGLGYYNRCKNLLATARIVANEYRGVFPKSYEGLLKLKGIGPYTAAAIASFAYNIPKAVVDGNVNRVLARYFGIETAFGSAEGKKAFQELAQELLDKEDSCGYNQAIMDLGATICTPQGPKCQSCPLQAHCIAVNKGLIEYLPVKTKKVQVKLRYFHYLLLVRQDKLWIHKRTGKDIWQNLYQPLLIEHSEAMDDQQIKQHARFRSLKVSAEVDFKGADTQRLTHQLIRSRFYTVEVKQPPQLAESEGQWVDFQQLSKYAFPKTLVSFLENNLYF